MADLRVAVIGYGLGGAAFHAPLIEATPGMAVSFIVTGNPERAADAHERYPGARVVASADDLWADAGAIDLVVVTSPNRHHAPQALAAIERGIAVVVDKPFAVDSDEAASVVAAAEAAGVPLSVYQNRRWDGDFLTLEQLLADGALGEVTRFESRIDRWRPEPKGGWRESGDAADAPGLLFDLGAHTIDQAYTLFGPVTHVYAEVDVRRDGVTADDDTFVALSHANGVRSHLWASVLASNIGPRFRVLGRRAAYVKDGADPQEAALRDGRRPDGDPDWGADDEAAWGTLGTPEHAEPVPTRRGAYQEFYALMGAAVRGEGPVPVDARDAVETLRIIESARRSAREHVVVAHGG
jgi:scyllo-inositol 2-dehydrogenase (NADP+)